MIDYKAIFDAIEESLYANTSDPRAFRDELNKAKHGRREVDDEEFYEITQYVVFASNTRVENWKKYHPGLRKHLPDIDTAASLTKAHIERIMQTRDVIRSEKKLNACVENARTIQSIIQDFGSTKAYIDSFYPLDSMRSIVKLRDDIKNRFRQIGSVTAFHLMTDLGLPVLKPDRVIMRVFERLGLVYDRSQELTAIEIGQAFANATGYPIRYIDIVIVSYGQVEIWGGNVGICLENKPKCDVCGVSNYCQFYGSQ